MFIKIINFIPNNLINKTCFISRQENSILQKTFKSNSKSAYFEPTPNNCINVYVYIFLKSNKLTKKCAWYF